MKKKILICCLGWLAFAASGWAARPSASGDRSLMINFQQYELGRLSGQSAGLSGGPWLEIGKDPRVEIVRPQDTSCGERVLRVWRTASGGARIATARPIDLEGGAIYFSADVNRGPEGGAIIMLIRGTNATAQGPGVYINPKGQVRVNVGGDKGSEIERKTIPGVLLKEGRWYRLEFELRPAGPAGSGEMDVFLVEPGVEKRQPVLTGVPCRFHPGPYDNLYVGPQSGELDVASILIGTAGR